MKASMPQVRKVLEAVIWRSDTKRDFRPIGSEQPEVFEYTMEMRSSREADRKKREREYDRQEMDTGQPVTQSSKQTFKDSNVEDESNICRHIAYRCMCSFSDSSACIVETKRATLLTPNDK